MQEGGAHEERNAKQERHQREIEEERRRRGASARFGNATTTTAVCLANESLSARRGESARRFSPMPRPERALAPSTLPKDTRHHFFYIRAGGDSKTWRRLNSEQTSGASHTTRRERDRAEPAQSRSRPNEARYLKYFLLSYQALPLCALTSTSISARKICMPG